MSEDESPWVLYVDDEPINLQVFEANFRGRYRLLLAGSGREALELLAQRAGDVALLISDQRMPEMGGVELLEAVRKAYPEVHRMLITAYSDLNAVTDAVNRGQVMRYIVKPWIKSELAAAIDDALAIYRLQLELRGLQTRMLQSDRLAAIGQISAGIAHELMNPVSYMVQNIATLRGELQVLERFCRDHLAQSPDPEVEGTLADLPSLLEDVEGGARHIREIATGIKKQAKGDDREQEADLAEVVGFAAKMARSEVGRRARVQVSGSPVRVRGGPVRLTQVVLNLLVNAAQAMEGLERPGLIEVRWAEDGGRVRLDVADNGCGIAAENLQQVFKPLFTTKAKGTGLGLGIAREIVREYGGELSLSSTPGAGTTVTVALAKVPPAR